jgi:putative membrane protein
VLIDYLKAIHIVFFVSWFAALFYIVRLFIYATEAQQRPEPAVRQALTDQLRLMQSRLWKIIGWPAMTGTLISGIWMISLNADYYLSQRWMILKLLTVVLLLGYHLACTRIMIRQREGIFALSSFRLRLLNELATVFLVAIVFLVILKSTSGLAWGIAGLLAFALTLMLAVTLYRRMRKNKGET